MNHSRGYTVYIFFTTGTLAFVLASLFFINREMNDLMKSLQHKNLASALEFSPEILDRNGQNIGDLGEKKRFFVPIKSLPPHVLQAFMSAEDRNFYDHMGIKPSSIIRALFMNIIRGHHAQGASTITQQLVRMMFLSSQKNLKRKFKEIFLALALEKTLSKDEIFETYLNAIYLGSNAYGVEAAARIYFAKHASELTLWESSMIAGMAKAPSLLSPHNDYKSTLKRQQDVLKVMYESHFITKNQWLNNRNLSLPVVPKQRIDEDYSSIKAMVKNEMTSLTSSASQQKGMKIYTHIDAALQKKSSQRFRDHIYDLDKREKQNNDRLEGAFLCVEPQSGAILALQGSLDFKVSAFNRATHTRRSLESVFPVFLVNLALSQGLDLHDPLPLSPFHMSSASAPAILQGLMQETRYPIEHLLFHLGQEHFSDFLSRLGLSYLNPSKAYPRGNVIASPFELATAMTSVFNQGVVVQPRLIKRFEGAGDKSNYMPRENTSYQDQNSGISYIAQYALQWLLREKLPSSNLDRVGAYVGVSEDLKDAWMIAGDSAAMMVVWIGAERGLKRISADRNDIENILLAFYQDLYDGLPSQLKSKTQVIPQGVAFKKIQIKTAKPFNVMVPFKVQL